MPSKSPPSPPRARALFLEGLPNLHVNLRFAAPRPDAQEAMVVEMQLYTRKTLELKGMQHRCYKITRAERMETVA